jgi:hypothetical protein
VAARDDERVAALDELLTTTRSVRRRLDLRRSVPREVIEHCLEIRYRLRTAATPTGTTSSSSTSPACEARWRGSIAMATTRR